MHTFKWVSDIIIHVKTPNTLYIVFTNPIVKIPSPKKTADRMAVFFTVQILIYKNGFGNLRKEAGGIRILLVPVSPLIRSIQNYFFPRPRDSQFFFP